MLHRNWRGNVAGATFVNGDSTDTGTVWPAAYRDVWMAPDARQGAPQPNKWLGSLVTDSKDATGTLYRRNRYYDPVSGRFTQEDPIGLAGGMNLYGYADGDPINFADPFGLSSCPKDATDKEREECEKKEAAEKERKASAQRQCRAKGIELLRGMFTPAAVTGAASVTAGMTTEYLASVAGADATRRLANLRAATRIPGRYVTKGLISAAATSAARAGAAASAGTAALWTGTAVLGLAAGYGIGVDAACRFDSDYYGAD